MILKIPKEFLHENWGLIQDCIDNAAPPTVYDGSERNIKILSYLLMDVMQAWIICNDDRKKIIVYGICLTRIIPAPFNDYKNLLIFGIHSNNLMGMEQYVDLYEKISDYALAKNLKEILFYSPLKKFIRFSKMYGGRADYTLCSLPLDIDTEKVRRQLNG